MTSPESPAVQDTGRLREVAEVVAWQHYARWVASVVGPERASWQATCVCGWKSAPMDERDAADAEHSAHLATELSAAVLREAATAITDNVRNEDWSKQDRGGFFGIVPKRWMALDLWIALGAEPADFETKIGASGWAETWATLLSSVRDGNTIRAALAAERDRLALDLQARDIAVREADRLREQVEAERDQAVLALGEVRGREARLVAERDDARESAASILNDAGALAETIRKVRALRERYAALPLNADGPFESGRWSRLMEVIEDLDAALGDIPSPTAPEAPDDLDRFIAEQMHDPEFRAAWERQAGRPLLDEATARAAGWLPLAEVLAALRDDEGMWEWAEQFGDSRNACVVSISDRERLALYLTERFAPQGADTKETTTDG